MTYNDAEITFADRTNDWKTAKVSIEQLEHLCFLAKAQRTSRVMLYLIPLKEVVVRNGVHITHKLSVGPAYMDNKKKVTELTDSFGK